MSPRWGDFGVELRGEQTFITDVEPERALYVCIIASGVHGAREQGQDTRSETSTGRARVVKNLVPTFINGERSP